MKVNPSQPPTQFGRDNTGLLVEEGEKRPELSVKTASARAKATPIQGQSVSSFLRLLIFFLGAQNEEIKQH